jgi:hypothetical protein
MPIRSFVIGALSAGVLLFALASTSAARAGALPNDCGKVDPTTAASSLGVAKASAYAYAGHIKLPPDQMDVVECGYRGVGFDPQVPAVSFAIYTPKKSDIQIVYSSLVTEKHPKLQSFSPNFGSASKGLVGPDPSGEKFEAYIVFMTASNIFRIHIFNLPSAAAAQTGALKVAAAL